jgi:hypothetical protein
MPAGRPASESDQLWAALKNGATPEAPPDGWGPYMLTAEGMKTAVRLWERRAEALAAYVEQHGADSASWPVAHPPMVLKVTDVAHAACLGCTWLGTSCDPDDTHALHRLRWDAQEHSITYSTDS